MILYVLLIVLSASSSVQAMEPESTSFNNFVDHAGTISLPENYRSQWSHIGSWLIADPEAPGYGFHDVYMQPDAVLHFLKFGEFPDGAVIIKEVRKIEAGAKTTGMAQWAGDVNIWFVMVKDGNGRFEDNPHWSDGWGWALFENKGAMKNVSQGFAVSCQGCQIPAKDNDWVFIEGYPTLVEE